MKIIGLTGPSGAGKGALGACLEARGIPVIDTDRVYHMLLVPPSPCLDELIEAFGRDILCPDGTLDRAALAALVFASGGAAQERHETLNRITHRHVIDKTNELLAAYRSADKPATVIDAPLLLEAGMDAMCDLVVAVLADKNIRLNRLLARDSKNREALLARIDAQPSDDFYRTRADMVVQNDTDVGRLEAAADEVLRRAEVTS